MIPVRAQCLPTVTATRELQAGHPLVGASCPACDGRLRAGDLLALVYIGPGANPEDQVKARAGRWHTGAAVAVHAACAGVEAAP